MTPFRGTLGVVWRLFILSLMETLTGPVLVVAGLTSISLGEFGCAVTGDLGSFLDGVISTGPFFATSAFILPEAFFFKYSCLAFSAKAM